MRSRSSRIRRGRAVAALGAALSAALAVGACSGDVKGGSLVDQDNPVDLSGQSYTVGGKNAEDHAVLCEIAVAVLKSVGAQVENRCNLGDTDANRKALLDGGIDMYWENTSTAWTTFLKEEKPVAGASPQYRAVEKKDLADNKIVWLEPTWFNATHVFVVNKDRARELGVETISNLADRIRSGDSGKICVDAGYQQDAETGLAGLERAYGFQAPRDQVRVLDPGEIYQATADQQDCLFGEVTGGDPRLADHDLTVLRDDKAFHPALNAAITVRQDVLERNDDLKRVFQPVARMITDDVMAQLRHEMAADDKSAAEVAQSWLREMGFIEGGV